MTSETHRSRTFHFKSRVKAADFVRKIMNISLYAWYDNLNVRVTMKAERTEEIDAASKDCDGIPLTEWEKSCR